MVTTTTDPHVTLQQPVVVTGNKVNAGPLVLKTTLGGQGKKLGEKGKMSSQQIRGRNLLLRPQQHVQ